MNELHICQMEVEKQCFEIFAQKISAKNMNNDLVFFSRRDQDFLTSWFETKSRFDNGVVGHGVGRGFGHGVGYEVGHSVLHGVSLF